VFVGGRVLDARGDWLVIGDAVTSLELRFEPAVALTPGDLVVVRFEPKGRSRRATLVERWPAAVPKGDGEVARLQWRQLGKNLRARSRALAVVRAYFDAQRFVEVDTPVRVRTPGLDVHVDALGAHGGFLVTSPEFHMKRLLAGGLPRIYQLIHCSRADEQGAQHEPEFMMLEWYRAFADQTDVMRDTEHVVESVTREIAGKPRLRLTDGRRIDVTEPYDRVSVREAFREHAGVADAVDLAATDESRYFELLVSAVEPALARRDRPVFLIDYPATQASLARRSPADPSVAERFELYVAGVELCNGFSELTCPVEQRQRFEHDQQVRAGSGRPVYPLDERFLAALAEGLPPAGGNALGFDRLLALACGTSTIAEVQAFPHDWS
jgi:lysyl-tRNA synthetase class 2